MNWAGTKALVTGADGFIGSHLVESLVDRGAEVRALVLYNSCGTWGWLDSLDREKLSKIEVVSGDIRDPHQMLDLAAGIDIIFHLAALVAIPHSYRAPDAYLETNAKGTLNILQAARRAAVKRIIHTSTSEVYGSAQFVPINEEHPLVGQSPYAASKIAGDQLAISFCRSFGLPVTIMRPFNTYGPRQSARAIIPTIVLQALAGAKVVRLGHRHTTRDFTYVTDTVEGLIRAAEHDGSIGTTINLGSNREIPIGALCEKIRNIMGCSFEIAFDPQRARPEPSEVDRLLADTTKARKILGWEPVVSHEQGLELTIAWFRENHHRYKTDFHF